jgi:hypothetical protein
VPVFVETDAEWIERVRLARARAVPGACGSSAARVGRRHETALAEAPTATPISRSTREVTTAGRIELLPFLHEQSITITAHRFGNPDRGAKRSSDTAACRRRCVRLHVTDAVGRPRITGLRRRITRFRDRHRRALARILIQRFRVVNHGWRQGDMEAGLPAPRRRRREGRSTAVRPERRLRAVRFGVYPNSAIARSTFLAWSGAYGSR